MTQTDTAHVLARLEFALPQIRRAGDTVERIITPPPRRWWRATPSVNTQAAALEEALRVVVDISEDLMSVGVAAEAALRTATAAVNRIAAALGRTQISAAVTALTLAENTQRRPIPMPWEPDRLQQLLRSISSLCQRVKAATETLAWTGPPPPATLSQALIDTTQLARALGNQYTRLAEAVPTT